MPRAELALDDKVAPGPTTLGPLEGQSPHPVKVGPDVRPITGLDKVPILGDLIAL